MTLPIERLEELEKIARAVEPHFVNNGWQKPDKPLFGGWTIFSDNGKGMGRQIIAHVPADKAYGFTEVAAHIATFDPPMCLSLISRIRELEERAAKAVYDQWQDRPGWVPWVERGSSFMQDEARRIVARALLKEAHPEREDDGQSTAVAGDPLTEREEQ